LSDSYVEKLTRFADRLIRTAMLIVDQCELPVTKQGFAHPNLLALTLLCRTVHNFKGVVVLTRERLLVEARVLARCCYEWSAAYLWRATLLSSACWLMIAPEETSD
jgi:hypothetical protein